MATVTIGRPYFDALLRRAEFHTSGQEFDTTPSLSNNVTISKAEHEYLLQGVREYNLLKSALFRGGLTTETLSTLLSGESEATGKEIAPHEHNDSTWNTSFARPASVPVSITAPRPHPRPMEYSPISDNTAVGEGLMQPRPHARAPYGRVPSYDPSDSYIDTPEKGEDNLHQSPRQTLSTHDQRTVLITNLSDRTTHKDLADIVRGGRLLDIFLRSDRSATISFVEGAQEFLAHAKRKDIYLHTKRLEFRWNDRQFHVPPHVANKIAGGATRNIVVRGAGAKLTTDQIRDHLDHIHNLVVVDIKFKNGDAFISTNSIHNALFARTCMMSRTVYKGLRIEWYPDECAQALPRPDKVQALVPSIQSKPVAIANLYSLLDTDEKDSESEEDELSYMGSGIRLNSNWADTAVA